MNRVSKCVDFLMKGNLSEAFNIFNDIKTAGSDEERLLLAEELEHLGFLQEAVSLYEKLLEVYPEEGELLVAVADIYINLDQEEEALNTLSKIANEDPYYVQALMLQADLYDSQGLFEVSEQKLLEAEKIEPNEPIIQFALAEIYANIGKFAEAVYKYEQILVHTEEIGHVNIHERLAELYSASGEFEKALQFYEHALQDKLDIDVLFGFGFTAYRAGFYQKAIGKLTEVKELDPEYQSVYLPLARSYEHEEDLQNALHVAKEGIRVNPYQKELYQFAGKICLKLGEEEEAEINFTEAISLDTSFVEAVLTLNKLYMKQQRYSDIIELVEPLLTEGEEDPYLLWDYAVACEEEEQYSNALNAYQRAYRYLKEKDEFLQNYGFFLLEEGNTHEAIEIFKKLQELDPTNAEYIDVLERLELGFN